MLSFTRIDEITSSSYTFGGTLILRDIDEDFVDDYLWVVPDAALKAYACFLEHYPDQISEFSSPLSHGTIRCNFQQNF